MVIYTRRHMIRAAKALRDRGELPPNVDNSALDGVRSASIILPVGADWREATEAARSAFGGVPVAYVTPT